MAGPNWGQIAGLALAAWVALQALGDRITKELVSITLSATNIDIQQGQTRQINAIGTFSDDSISDITSSVIWSSSNPSVATVSASGLIVAVSPGNAVITAELGGVAAGPAQIAVTTELPVNLAPVVTVAMAPASLKVGQQGTFTVTVTDDGLPGPLVDEGWQVMTGPGTAFFSAPNSRSTQVSFDTVGNWTLQYFADDGQLISETLINVLVTALALPTVTITSPTAGQLISSSSIGISGSTTKDPTLTVAAVHVRLDGGSFLF